MATILGGFTGQPDPQGAPVTGAIQVTPLPSPALDGADWTLTGPSHPGGLAGTGPTLVSNLTQGAYSIAWADNVAGYDPPSNTAVNVNGAGPFAGNGTYASETGDISVTVNQQTATWTITGPSHPGGYAGTGDDSLASLAAGQYDMVWDDNVAGYDPPSGSSVTVNGDSQSFNGTYSAEGGYVRPAVPAYGEHVLGTNYDVPIYWGGKMFKNILHSGEGWKDANGGSPYIPMADVDQNGNLLTLSGSNSGDAVSRINIWENGSYNIEYTGVGSFNLAMEGSSGSGSLSVTATGGDATSVFTVTGLNDYDDSVVALYVTSLGSPTLEFRRMYHQKYAAEVVNGNPLIPSRIADAQYYGALRMMDWVATAQTEYDGWPNCEHATQANYHEYCRKSYLQMVQVNIDIANHCNRDLWVNILHRFDDNDIDLIVDLLEADYVPGVNGGGLNPALKWYCEFSNEVWNGGSMPGAWYCEEQGTALRDASHPQFGGGLSDFEATHRFQVWRSKQIMDRIAAHAKAPAMPSRCVRVLAGWMDVPYVLDQMLNAISVDGVKYAKDFDAVAINPYIYEGPLDRTNGDSDPPRNDTIDTMNDVFYWLDVAHSEIEGYLQLNRDLIDTLPSATSDTLGTLDVLCYEGGQHVFTADTPSQNHFNLIANAQIDERMRAQYIWLLNAWSAQGFGMFMHFTDSENPSDFGGWGAKWDSVAPDDGYPKFQELLDWQDSKVNP